MIDFKKMRQDIERETAKKLALLDEHEGTFEEAAKAFDGLNIVSQSLDENDLNLNVTGSKHDLQAMFGRLRKAGFEPGSRPQAGQSSYAAYWEHKDGTRLWVYFASTSCRRVKVGTKMIEQEVYETVCDEMILEPTITETANEVPF